MEHILKHKLKNGLFDNVSPLRSKMMRAVKGKNNKSTELKLRMALVKAGIKGWILHPANVFGKPDILFLEKRLAIFVDGCFWHGCDICGRRVPKTRTAFWRTKLENNQTRAKVVKSNLRKQSIKVVRVWEHSLKTSTKIKGILKRILSYVHNS